jgi:hypothetical protein
VASLCYKSVEDGNCVVVLLISVNKTEELAVNKSHFPASFCLDR